MMKKDLFGYFSACIIQPVTLPELFATFNATAFRLEGRSIYAVDEEKEAIEFYRSNGQLLVGFGKEWLEFVQDQTNLGKKIQRLRLLSDNLSDYETFELCAFTGIEGGEDIRYARRSDYSYEYDFWLFDNRWLAKMIYDKDGRYTESIVSEMTSREHERIKDWLNLYSISPSISEIATHSK